MAGRPDDQRGVALVRCLAGSPGDERAGQLPVRALIAFSANPCTDFSVLSTPASAESLLSLSLFSLDFVDSDFS